MSNKMALDALTELVALEHTEENEWDGVERVIPEMCKLARAAIAALQAEPQPAPYLCIAPACGPKCSDCNSAISDATMRRYAIRYAYLREHDPRFGMPTAWLAFQTLDEAVDAALPDAQSPAMAKD